MSLAEHVKTLGRGPGRSRSLTEAEAQDAMRAMLANDAAAEAVGALLMLLQMKGETAAEIAGFARAAQETARNVDEANSLLGQHGIVYLPLEALHPGLFRLLKLREVLGLRSCINTVCRMLNPGRTNASVQGVFHPSYRPLQADAAAQLGWQSLSVIKGGGGEFERHPSKQIEAFGLRHGQPYQATLPALVEDTRRLATATGPALKAAQDLRMLPAFETQVILGTAALAFDTLGARHAAAQATPRQGTTVHLQTV